MSTRNKAILALLLLVPAPIIGTLFGMVICPDSQAGTLIFAARKVWRFGLPVGGVCDALDHIVLGLVLCDLCLGPPC